ncbi:amino acid permease [Fusarium pseudocircinatum]|uniref:Amino acid permease n=1 Tax=Fusarium pseudocircinatum TaxID=56676 RepID=A0A8H5PLH8_9HYPO|nr:amino acid permease [Fusarium pseudocircinatum]
MATITTMKADLPKDSTLHHSPSRGNGEVENTTVKDPGLQRGLAGRHLMMLAIGGVIGPGYFVGMGTGLSTAGPAGLLLCFAIVGVLLWAVMQSLGELGAFIPMSGSFTHYTAMFVDPALGFALGWNYALLWAGIIIAEYNNLGLVLTYWESPIPRWGWILIFWGIFLAFTFLGIKSFGEAEFWLALIKILAILAFFLCAILITSGVIGNEKVGFKFYHDPGPFADGVKGIFKIFVFAALQYSGTEMVGLTAGESKNPAKDVPKAVKSILWRIVGIFLLGIFFLTITVPYNDPNLLSATSKTARSPFVIAFTRVGANAGAHAINAIILITMFSSINSALYVGSRTLYGLAIDGLAPKIFCWTNSRGVPAYSLLLMNLIGFLSLLNLSSGAGVVYSWIVSMTGVATFITWGLISLCHIRLRQALAAQNISTDVLPFKAPAWRFCAYLGLVGNVFFVFFQGWTAFAPWDVQAFFMNYVIVLIFIVLAVGWKFINKTKIVALKSVEFSSARLWNIEMQMQADAETLTEGKRDNSKE